MRGTRKPLSLPGRGGFLAVLAALFALLVWEDLRRFSPPARLGEIVATVARDQRWILWLAAIEAARQVHFLVSEHDARYHRFWTQRVFGDLTRRYERRVNVWNRFRIARTATWILAVVLGAVVLGAITGGGPVATLFTSPGRVVPGPPVIIRIVLPLVFATVLVALVPRLLSRGGVETTLPDDNETRFGDLWGQDHVIGRIKEDLILLEDPESIESRGGHVPSGILLWGPPGTGKSLLAEAVAGETGKPYVVVDPGALRDPFRGAGTLRVKGLFRHLRRLAVRYGGVIVLFDGADSFGSRGGRVDGTPAAGAPAPGQHAGCNGFTQLSPGSRWAVARQALADDGTAPAAGRSRGGPRDRVVTGTPAAGGDTLRALLTELSGVTRPRGLAGRVIRPALGMRPKPPPRYRILVMMATSRPDALDPALLRPGRIDRTYRVGHPSRAGRVRTYQGYLDRTRHALTPEQVDRLATITPYATGASMKDLVNEALILAVRESREVITWHDVLRAQHLSAQHLSAQHLSAEHLSGLGPSGDVEHLERERHAVAVHEACHAVAAWAARGHPDLGPATIERGGPLLGTVASLPPEDGYPQWRSGYESDIVVSVASLAGERLFFGGDTSSGVAGDLHAATVLAGLMESRWGMGSGISSLPALRELGIPGREPEFRGGPLAGRIEATLVRLLEDAGHLLDRHRVRVLALAHALETHRTLSGEDVAAVLEGRPGELVDGRPYRDPDLLARLESYHEKAVLAHTGHTRLTEPMPVAVGPDRPSDPDPGRASDPDPGRPTDPDQPYPDQSYPDRPYPDPAYPYPAEQARPCPPRDRAAETGGLPGDRPDRET